MSNLKIGTKDIIRTIKYLSGKKFSIRNLKNLEIVHENMKFLLDKMNYQHKIIINSLLQKSLSKFNSKSLYILNHFNLLTFNVVEYNIVNSDNHVEYLIEIEDKLMQRVWTFYTRYAHLRELHNNLQKISHQPYIDFPSKTWIYNKDKNFLNQRLHSLKIYFAKLLSTKCYENIIDNSNFKDFLYSSIWKQMENNFDDHFPSITKWSDLRGHEIKNDFQYQQLLTKIKDFEIRKLDNKLLNIAQDMDILEQNDTICLMHFDEKMKEDLDKQKLLNY